MELPDLDQLFEDIDTAMLRLLRDDDLEVPNRDEDDSRGDSSRPLLSD